MPNARNNLFQLLSDIPGKPTYIVMLDFAQYQTDIEYRKRYEMYAKRHAETDAEFDPWQPGDIACFSEETERAPQNHRELFNMAVSRLLDLKAYLEDGDTSIADMIQSVRDEPKTRNYIGGWLREKSLGRYSVPQEEELADGTKPDIRIHGAEFDAPVSIELKIADNWSATKHVERLNNQLVGQYLRDIRSNCGIFLLVYCGKQTYWKHPSDGKKLDFFGLIGILKEGAKEIIDKDNKIESIKIVGIDLTKRNTKKALVVKR